MAKGGYREGAGRKPKTDELKVQNLAVSSIESKYGSVEKGFKSLLDTGEPSLIKFVWEHAVGKPREKVDVDLNTPQYENYSNDDLMKMLGDIYSKLSTAPGIAISSGTDGAGTTEAASQGGL